MFKALLTALGLAPKTLDQARGTLTEAKTFAENVNALFAAASLNLETFLSAGPDSLKLHLAGLDQAAEVTRLTGELATATTDLATAKSTLGVRDTTLAACNTIFATIGLADVTNATPSTEIKTKFEAHVAKATTLALAKTGHPPAHVPAAVDPTSATATDAALAAEYEKLPRGEAKTAFYAKHEQALWRHEKSTRNRAE